MSCQKCKYRLGKKCAGDSDVSNNKYYVVDSYNHKPINWKSFSDNGYVFQKNVLSLHRLTHAESPNGQKVGRHTYGKRRFCTLWFWRSMNFANSTVSQKQSNAERLMRCIIYSPHWLRTILLFVVKSAFYILTLAWGFRRCSFRLTGQCEGLSIVERVTEPAPRFFVCISECISSTMESVGIK